MKNYRLMRGNGVKAALMFMALAVLQTAYASPVSGSTSHGVNFENQVQYSDGSSLTAKLKTSAGTWEAETGEVSECQEISEDICDKKFRE